MKRIIITLAIVLIFLAGCAMILYPLVSNSLYEKNQSHVVAAYNEVVAQTGDIELEEAWAAAADYNRLLTSGEAVLTDPFDPDAALDPTVEPYASLLNLSGDGMMGYVEIPKIDVYLPVLHGTSPQVLERGIGHLQNTSLPVGGEGNHTVLTGHTGLAGKRLFTDLTELEEGDVFYLHILGETLAYQVYQIEIVEPTDTSLLVVQPGRDLATLLTCYPYGINSHRLLVFGERIPYEAAVTQEAVQTQDAVPAESVWKREYQRAVILCLVIYVPLTAGIILIVFLRRRHSQRSKPGKFLRPRT